MHNKSKNESGENCAGVSEPPLIGKAAPGALPAGSPHTPPLDGDTAERIVRFTFRLSERRRQLLPNDIFDDAAWCLLLDLYLGHLQGKTFFVSAICANPYSSPTTSLRRLEDIIVHGLAARQRDHADSRRISVVLTATGLETVQAYASHICAEAFLAFSPVLSNRRAANAAADSVAKPLAAEARTTR